VASLVTWRTSPVERSRTMTSLEVPSARRRSQTSHSPSVLGSQLARVPVVSWLVLHPAAAVAAEHGDARTRRAKSTSATIDDPHDHAAVLDDGSPGSRAKTSIAPPSDALSRTSCYAGAAPAKPH